MAAATTLKLPGTLRVTVKHANGLAAKDLNGKSDPYAKVGFVNAAGKWVGQHEKEAQHSVDWAQSKIIKETLDPVWNFVSEWHVTPSEADRLKIELWDWDRASKDDFLGEVFVPLTDITSTDDNRKVEVTLNVKHRPGKEKSTITGNVTFTLEYYSDERRAADEAAARAEEERKRKEQEERRRKEEEERRRREEEARLAALAEAQKEFDVFYAEGSSHDNAMDRFVKFTKFPELLDNITNSDRLATTVGAFLRDGEGNDNVFQRPDGVAKWIEAMERVATRYFVPTSQQTEATKAAVAKLVGNASIFKLFWPPVSNTARKRAESKMMHTAEIIKITEALLNAPEHLEVTFDKGFALLETLVLDTSQSEADITRGFELVTRLMKMPELKFSFDAFFYYIKDAAVEALQGIQRENLPDWSFVVALAHNAFVTYTLTKQVRAHGTEAQKTAYFREVARNKLNTLFCWASGLTLLPQLQQPKEAGMFIVHERLFWSLLAFQQELAAALKGGAKILDDEVLSEEEMKLFEIMLQWRIPGGTRAPSRTPSLDELKAEKAKQVQEAAMEALARQYGL